MNKDQIVLSGEKIIRYSHFEQLLEILKLYQQMYIVDSKPYNIIVEGLPKTGKTCLVKTFACSFLPKETGDGVIFPVRYLLMPASPTWESPARKMLDALDDQMAYKEYKMSLTDRLIKLIQTSKIELIILDKFDYLENSHSRVVWEVLDWLMALIEETQIPFLLVRNESKNSILSPYLRLSIQPYGGHVGFIDLFPFRRWIGQAALAIMESDR